MVQPRLTGPTRAVTRRGDALRDALGAGGTLARLLPGFAPRTEQQALAAVVEQAIEEGAEVVCEAGTGTGKTLAYLLPVLASGRRAVVSTGTRHLQDQVYGRDLPLAMQALGVHTDAVLLKGRANYLCLYRLEQALARPELALGDGKGAALAAIARWAARTRTGDIAEVDAVGEGSPLWPAVTSTAENCLGSRCPQYARCHLLAARARAAEADLVVVNHHLFLADRVLREEGFGALLPGAEVVVFDEAHQLPELLPRFLGERVSRRQLARLASDVDRARLAEAPELEVLSAHAGALVLAADRLAQALDAPGGRGEWSAAPAAAREALDGLLEAATMLAGALDGAAAQSLELEQLARRAGAVVALLERYASADAEEGWLRWYERSGDAVALHRTPVDVADAFGQMTAEGPQARVFVSATLAVGEDFRPFVRRLGLEGAACHRWDSPFDYARQALAYLPPIDRQPGAPDYTDAVVDAALPVLAASGGGAFMLFTSHQALRRAEALLRGRLGNPLLVQGEAPRSELLARFRAAGDAVLLGTASFWEGVDVRGEALSCVIIDKLPFAPPDDPVLKARCERLRAAGGDPFREIQLPEAVLALKQGAGRLIRDVRDRGVLVLCDPRLTARGYGRAFLRALPPMPVTSELDDVRAFFQRGERRAGHG